MIICKDCKWGVVGKYSKVYGGCPIGCEKPDSLRNYGMTVKDFTDRTGCFVEKEKK